MLASGQEQFLHRLQAGRAERRGPLSRGLALRPPHRERAPEVEAVGGLTMGADPLASAVATCHATLARSRCTPSTCARSPRATAPAVDRGRKLLRRACRSPSWRTWSPRAARRSRRWRARACRPQGQPHRRACRSRGRRPRNRRKRKPPSPRSSRRATSGEGARAGEGPSRPGAECSEATWRAGPERAPAATMKHRAPLAALALFVAGCASAPIVVSLGEPSTATDGEGLRRRAQAVDAPRATCAATSTRRSTSTPRCARRSSASRTPPSTSSCYRIGPEQPGARARRAPLRRRRHLRVPRRDAPRTTTISTTSTSAKTVWRVTLVDDEGHRGQPVARSARSRSAARSTPKFYPYATIFSRGWTLPLSAHAARRLAARSAARPRR